MPGSVVPLAMFVGNNCHGFRFSIDTIFISVSNVTMSQVARIVFAIVKLVKIVKMVTE